MVDRRTTVKRQVSESQNLRPKREHGDDLAQLSREQRHNWDPGPCPLLHTVQFPKMGELRKDIS